MRLCLGLLCLVTSGCGSSGSSSSNEFESNPGKDRGGCTSLSIFMNGPRHNPQSLFLETLRCVEGEFEDGTVVDRNWCSTYPPQNENTIFDISGCTSRGRTAQCTKALNITYSFYTNDKENLRKIKIICEERNGTFSAILNSEAQRED